VNFASYQIASRRNTNRKSEIKMAEFKVSFSYVESGIKPNEAIQTVMESARKVALAAMLSPLVLKGCVYA
jgi:hypothetical protein